MKSDAELERKNKSGGKQRALGSGADAPFRGYINLVLSAEEKSEFVSWVDTHALWDELQRHVESGVNVSLKADPKTSGFLASATQRNVNSPNAGLVVTARADDAGKALCRVVFCLVVLSRSERWEDRQPLADPDRW